MKCRRVLGFYISPKESHAQKTTPSGHAPPGGERGVPPVQDRTNFTRYGHLRERRFNSAS
jgi:hypothetical protein